MGTFKHFYKKAFCRQLADPLNPFIPSYWNVQKYSLIQFQWNHPGYFSYDQGSPRKVKSIFLEHFYFFLVVLLIVIVSDVSCRSRRSTWRRTRRSQDSDEPGKQPFDHDEPFYIVIAFSLLHWVHDIPWMATLLGLPPLPTPLILALFMTLPLIRVVLVGCRNML